MISTLKIDAKIRYRDVGEGPVVVLLHGYLETLKVWNGIVDELRDNFRVIAPDLPGQGHSAISKDIQTMDSMAEGVMLLLNHLGIEKCFMVGHSMGGYVTLAFLEKYPKMLTGISLFHSSPFADTDEKRENRNREIELLRNGKKNQLYNTHMPKVFASENVEKHQKKLAKLKERAQKTPQEFIVSVIEGMKIRPDRTEILKNTILPVQYIIGAKDNFIPMNILDKLKLPKNSEVFVLEDSGHMGMYEEKKESAKALREFIEKVKT
jgi:pimeloyl-ACP methyl ester carboxylesterase